MVLTQTNTKDFKLGSQAPHFALPEPLTGGTVSLDDVRGTNGTLVVFLSNHCPFVIHIQAELNRLGSDLKQMGIGMVGISASDVRAYPQDGPDIMKSVAETRLTTFPYLYDETQVISKQFKALCTPDFYLFDKNLRLAYRCVRMPCVKSLDFGGQCPIDFCAES